MINIEIRSWISFPENIWMQICNYYSMNFLEVTRNRQIFAICRFYCAVGRSLVRAIIDRSRFTIGRWRCKRICADDRRLVSLY